jgi:hypothetical protein
MLPSATQIAFAKQVAAVDLTSYHKVAASDDPAIGYTAFHDQVHRRNISPASFTSLRITGYRLWTCNLYRPYARNRCAKLCSVPDADRSIPIACQGLFGAFVSTLHMDHFTEDIKCCRDGRKCYPSNRRSQCLLPQTQGS